MNPWSVVLGAIVTGILSYRVVPWLVDRVEAEVLESLNDRRENVGPRLPRGDVVGHLECAIFFLSFVLLQSALLAAGWLAFKTAAKWKTWASIEEGVPLAETQVRYRSFVIGTAANIVAALIGAGIAHLP